MRIRVNVGVGLASALAALAMAAPAHAADPVIAAAGDIACSPADQYFKGGSGSATLCRQKYTSNQLVNAGLDVVLPLGDNQYEDGTLAEYRGSYDLSWGRANSISHPVMGNHERGGSGFYDYFNGVGASNGRAGQRGKGYYSYDVGAWHIIALNTSDKCSVLPCDAGSEQEQWLRADLAAHPMPCTLAYWHEPLFSSKTTYSSGTAFWSDLHAAGAEIVLNGHVHNYERFAPQTPRGAYDANGIREFVVGTGGRSLESSGSAAKNSQARISSSFGVLKLTLHPTSYDWRFVTEGGTTKDSGSANCHGSSALPPPPPPPPPLAPPPPSPPPSRVDSERCTVVGTNQDDLLTGTSHRDVICGFGGNDRIRGLGGNDYISGGDGNDRVLGGRGRDRLYGGSGDDGLVGSRGSDRIYGGGGDDRLAGGRGSDRLFGGGGRDRLLGNGGNDRLIDRAGSDWIFGNSGNDVLISSLARRGRDVIDGGPGRDRASVKRRDRVRRVELFFHFRRSARR